MPYVNYRWLGGMLTNFQTVAHARRRRCRSTSACVRLRRDRRRCPRRKALKVSRELEKLERNLGGIRNMSKLPDAVFVIDTKKEHIARHRGQPARHPGRRRRRHQLRPRRHRLRDPRQRRRHPLRQPDVPRSSPTPSTRAASSPRAATRGRRRRPRAARRRADEAARSPPSRPRRRRQAAAAAGRARSPRRGRASGADRGGSRAEAEAAAAEPRPAEAAAPRPPTPRPRTRRRRRRRRRGRRARRPPTSRPRSDRPQWLSSPRRTSQALRKATGAGMMDCKKALEETDGDIEAAKDWLREKGLAGAAKRAGPRRHDQGAVDVVVDGSVGALVELNCETDFVAKGERLQRGSPTTSPTLVAAERRPTPRAERLEATVDELQAHAQGEHRARPRRALRGRRRQLLDGYLHIQNERGVIGVLVELGGVDARRQVAHDIALHIAFAAPEVPHPRRGARRRGRRRSGPTLEEHHPQRGQARAGDPEDRRGPAQRLLQGRSCCSSSRS